MKVNVTAVPVGGRFKNVLVLVKITVSAGQAQFLQNVNPVKAAFWGQVKKKAGSREFVLSARK
jgi:hypothetical protein